MSDTPRRRDDQPGDEPDFAQLFQQFLGDSANPAMGEALKALGLDQADPAMMGMLAAQLRALFDASPTHGINRELSQDVARKTVSSAGDAVVSEGQRRDVVEAVHVADLWLDEVTSFTAPGAPALAWSRAEWVEHTMDTWARLVGPVAEGVNGAVSSAMRNQMRQLGEGGMPAIPGLPPGLDLAGMMGQFEPMLARMGSSMFGAQIGQAVGALAADIVSATEVGLPLLASPAVALLPANVDALAADLELDAGQVRLYLALRESARTRLFASVAWLGPQLLAAVEAYARDITIDTEGIERKLGEIDATDPQAMQAALSKTLFSPEPSEAQKAALSRLETLLALVEGWVDVVAERAGRARLPQSGALAEAIRRRRASGGPAEAIFGELVGLQLRPRRLRDAANLFSALESSGGPGARDGAWAHPDVAPTAADLDDVLAYVERTTAGSGGGPDADLTAELDAALDQILRNADRERSREEAWEAGAVEGPTDGGPWPDGPRPRGRRDVPGETGPGSTGPDGGPADAGGPGGPDGAGAPPAPGS